jgi:hypothetical protein
MIFASGTFSESIILSTGLFIFFARICNVSIGTLRTIVTVQGRTVIAFFLAIVVFPGGEPLREWLSGGHILDAEISEPLIMSIFDPHSPGHDGSMIVQNGKLSMFVVRLPVSTNGKLAEEFGMRHHAAMGLSEKTDALSVVVSGESGNKMAGRRGDHGSNTTK